MECGHHPGNASNSDEGNGGEATVYHPNEEVGLGDVIWVKLRRSSWWPAQVVDGNYVSKRIKPRSRSASEVLVRLYGSYKYRYADPVMCRSEFQKVLKKNNGNCGGLLEKALEQDLARLRSEGGKGNESEFEEEGWEARSTEHKDTKMQSEVEENNTRPIKISPKRLFPENTEETKSGKQKKKSSQSKSANALGKSQELCARRMKVMQNLGLVAPNGSPFQKN